MPSYFSFIWAFFTWKSLTAFLTLSFNSLAIFSLCCFLYSFYRVVYCILNDCFILFHNLLHFSVLATFSAVVLGFFTFVCFEIFLFFYYSMVCWVCQHRKIKGCKPIYQFYTPYGFYPVLKISILHNDWFFDKSIIKGLSTSVFFTIRLTPPWLWYF